MKTAEPAAVLDASALLAYVHREPGYEIVREAIQKGAVISAVNLAEALGKLKAKGLDPTQIGSKLEALGLLAVPFDEEDALLVAELDPLTRPKGLSLGDRACLALAKRLGLPALTADRAWAELPLPVKVEVIR